MYHANDMQLAIRIPTSPAAQDSTQYMQVDQGDKSLVVRNDMQNGGFPHAEYIINYSKKLEEDLQTFGMKIKQHEDNIKFLKTQKNKFDESILDLQVVLGKYHSSGTTPVAENEVHSHPQSDEETMEQIMRQENSAAGILCKLSTHHAIQAYNLMFTKDVLGIVARLGKVDDDNLSRLLSEYLGMQTMLTVVCRTYDGVKALETYDREGCINKSSGLHGLGASIGRILDGRFIVICLEHLRPYAGGFIANDPQRRLDLLKPREDVQLRFPKASVKSSLPENYIESERQIKELKWKKEKVIEDIKREQALLDNSKLSFDRKKAEFLKFLAESSSYAAQQQLSAKPERLTPR